jgi:hypothetical protein
MLNRICPIGYEDETGFHYGEPATEARGGAGSGD